MFNLRTSKEKFCPLFTHFQMKLLLVLAVENYESLIPKFCIVSEREKFEQFFKEKCVTNLASSFSQTYSSLS